MHRKQLPACPTEKVNMSWEKHGPAEAFMPPVLRRFLSIFIVRYHQGTFTPFYLQYINMTLKNILQWENSRATVGPHCLINRDFKRQCRISMVLQGSAKGQARGGGRKGEGSWTGIYGLSKDTVLTPQPFRLKLESKRCRLSQNINTKQHEGAKQQSPIHHGVKRQLF